MATAEGLTLAAGGIAFVGSFKEAGGFPSNGYAVIAGTSVLTFLAALSKSTAIAGPIVGLAGLMLLAACIRYIPGLASSTATKKGHV